eukprot:TRINITY_DN8223_c0_g1_i1.p1 TRINITY_DN8223_c0_g1~~TRINITY_DN8223_c0_g1_i1.p1  ORF type:complete len:1248 (+),score=160.64 TRINITY_DN8223_c0_g1_i1:80-3823(+)
MRHGRCSRPLPAAAAGCAVAFGGAQTASAVCPACPCTWWPFEAIYAGACSEMLTTTDDCGAGADRYSSISDKTAETESNPSHPTGCVYVGGTLYVNTLTTSVNCSQSMPCICGRMGVYETCSTGTYAVATGHTCDTASSQRINDVSTCTAACRALGLVDSGSSASTVLLQKDEAPPGCYWRMAETGLTSILFTRSCYYNSRASPSCVAKGNCGDMSRPSTARPVVCRLLSNCNGALSYCPAPTASPSASPSTPPTGCDPYRANCYRPVAGVGLWAGNCTCPDLQTYLVGDNDDKCQSLACENGVPGPCVRQNLLTKPMKVTCALIPTSPPSAAPSAVPTVQPTSSPSDVPTGGPSAPPTWAPSGVPSTPPTPAPQQAPTTEPSGAPVSAAPTALPTTSPPSARPSTAPTSANPTSSPSAVPTGSPTRTPSAPPSGAPSQAPSSSPSGSPLSPSVAPSAAPSRSPITPSPSAAPASARPSGAPSLPPTAWPSSAPSAAPSQPPSRAPTAQPSRAPRSATPSAPPSTSPSPHPCADGSHHCADPPGGICLRLEGGHPAGSAGLRNWRCECAAAFACAAGCGADQAGHRCVMLSAPPSPQPSRAPTAAPSGAAPTVSPAQPPSAAPTAGPTAAPSAWSWVLSPQAEERREMLKGVPVAALAASSGAASAAVGLASTGNAGKIAVLANIDCVIDDVDLGDAEPLDWEFHPVGQPIGSHVHMYFLGAVLFNTVVIVAFACALGVGIATVSWGLGRPLAEAAGDLKCPGLCYLPIMFLLQGTSLAASNMAFHPGRAPGAVAIAGWTYLLICVALPGVLWFTILRGTRFRACTVRDPRLYKTHIPGQPKPLQGTKRKFYKWVFGTTVWVTAPPIGCEMSQLNVNDFFVEQLGLFFESYRGSKHWFILAEMGNMIALSVLAVLPVGNPAACHLRNSAIVLLLAAFLFLIFRHRPYQSQLDNVVAVMMALMMLVSVLLNTIAIIIGKPGDLVDVLLMGSADLLLVSAIMLMVKACYDLSFYFYDVHLSRRSGVRADFRKRNAARTSCETVTAVSVADLSFSEGSVSALLSPRFSTDPAPAPPGAARQPSAFDGGGSSETSLAKSHRGAPQWGRASSSRRLRSAAAKTLTALDAEALSSPAVDSVRRSSRRSRLDSPGSVRSGRVFSTADLVHACCQTAETPTQAPPREQHGTRLRNLNLGADSPAPRRRSLQCHSSRIARAEARKQLERALRGQLHTPRSILREGSTTIDSLAADV